MAHKGKEEEMREKLEAINTYLKEMQSRVTDVVRQQTSYQDQRKQILQDIIIAEGLLREGSWELKVRKHPFLFCENDKQFPKLRELLTQEDCRYDSLTIGRCYLTLDDGELYLSPDHKASIEEFSNFISVNNIEFNVEGLDEKIDEVKKQIEFYEMMKTRFGE